MDVHEELVVHKDVNTICVSRFCWPDTDGIDSSIGHLKAIPKWKKAKLPLAVNRQGSLTNGLLLAGMSYKNNEWDSSCRGFHRHDPTKKSILSLPAFANDPFDPREAQSKG